MAQPNILFITSDQHRADALGVEGHPCVRTPHLDRLAFGGMRFRNAYADCPICIPARTTMITGIQAHRYGMPSYADRYRLERDRGLMLGSLMTRAGYQTHLVGKTHWHLDSSHRAGFEYVDGFDRHHEQVHRATGRAYGTTGIGANELTPSLSQVPPHLHNVDWAVDRSIDFLRHRDRTQPFFLWLSVHDPHPPLVIHEPFYSMYDDADIPEPLDAAWAQPGACPHAIEAHRTMYNPGSYGAHELRKARGVYYGMLTNLDLQLGRLFGWLMQERLWDDTLVVYTSDHGEHLGDFGDIAKSSFLEPSARLPFIVRWPRWMGCEPGRVSDALIEHADLLPTFCEVAGVDAPADITGTSFMPLVRGEAAAVRATMHGHIDDSHMYHDGRYKYLYFAGDGRELVFDTATDREDRHDLSGDTALTGRLREAFMAHLAKRAMPTCRMAHCSTSRRRPIR